MQAKFANAAVSKPTFRLRGGHEMGGSPGTAPPEPPTQPTTGNLIHPDLGKLFLVLLCRPNVERARKVGIVALARKLLIALWRYVEQGELPAGAQQKDWRLPVSSTARRHAKAAAALV